MKVHKAVQVETIDTIITFTLCKRSHSKSTDGYNSTDNDNEVTCKLCLGIMQDATHWRHKKYLKVK